MKYILITLSCIFLALSCSSVKNTPAKKVEKEYFEGWVTYKTTPIKPDMVSQEDWDKSISEVTGNKGYILHKNYYKPGMFCSEIDAGKEIGKQIYNPIDSLHYAWQIESDTALSSNLYAESFLKITEIIELDSTAVVNGIDCNAIKVVMNMGSYTVWYNSAYLKTNAEEYKGNLFDRKVIEKIGCLPLKSVVTGLISTEMMAYEEGTVPEAIFNIPKFKHIEEEPQF